MGLYFLLQHNAGASPALSIAVIGGPTETTKLLLVVVFYFLKLSINHIFTGICRTLCAWLLLLSCFCVETLRQAGGGIRHCFGLGFDIFRIIALQRCFQRFQCTVDCALFFVCGFIVCFSQRFAGGVQQVITLVTSLY